MKRIFFALVLGAAIAAAGCGHVEFHQTRQIRQNLNGLKIGMDKAAVMKQMKCKPYATESYAYGVKNLEFWLYRIESGNRLSGD